MYTHNECSLQTFRASVRKAKIDGILTEFGKMACLCFKQCRIHYFSLCTPNSGIILKKVTSSNTLTAMSAVDGFFTANIRSVFDVSYIYVLYICYFLWISRQHKFLPEYCLRVSFETRNDLTLSYAQYYDTTQVTKQIGKFLNHVNKH